MRKKNILWILLTVVVSMGFILASCDSDNGGSSDDCKDKNCKDCRDAVSEKHGQPWESIVDGTPTAKITQSDVADMLKTLDKISAGVITKPDLPCCDDLTNSGLGLDKHCSASGNVSIRNCAEYPLSFDIVFDECYSQTTPEIIGYDGVISIEFDNNSSLVLSVDYLLDVYSADPAPDVALDQIVNLFVALSGKTIQFTFNIDGTITVNGIDADTGAACAAIIVVDPTEDKWTSDGGCGLPPGPISY